MPISIHPVPSIEACRHIEELQAKIWECSSLEVVPDHMLWTMAKEGGMVLIANSDTGEPVGFAFGFLSLTADRRLKLASHQVGVLPAYQSSGIGYQLKLTQRKLALARQLNLITWTFDPLQGRNANLNLHKLGAVSNTYLPNLYGEMRDELNQGLPSDRFRVDWDIGSEHVANRLAGHFTTLEVDNYPLLNPATIQNGFLAPPDAFEKPVDTFCLIEIPDDINDLKVIAPDLALRWRLHTRQIFETAFGAGYIVVDLLRREERNFYVLQKDWYAALSVVRSP